MNIRRRPLLIALGLIAAAGLLYAGRVQLTLLLRLLLTGGAISYLFYPLSRWFSSKLRLNRTISILCAYLSAAALLALIVVLFLPPLIGQMRELIAAAPGFANALRCRLHSVNQSLDALGLSRLSLPEFNWERILSTLPPLLGGTASFAGSLVSRFAEWTLAFLLSYYFLRDRERVLLHLELLVPSAFRKTALRMAASVHQEIGTFLRGQLLISLIVAALSAFALMLSGVKSFLALGLIVGIFNMIPYFGPLLGSIPAVLMALTQGFGTALLAALSLFAVQQLDSMFISPRIMGALTGLHPGTVLLAITLGSSFSGIAGMLLAIPFALAVRAVSRVWFAHEPQTEQL